MADIAGKLGVAEQIRVVAGLRWQILRNQLRKKGSRLDLLGMIWAAIFAGILVLGLSFAFYWGAYTSLSTGHFGWMVFLFWGIFLFWQAFPIFLAGFGATFEFRNLLRFPLSMSAFYLVGLAYGPALLPIVVLFLLMNVTLERLLGSWFERLLARRRTRELIFGLIILLSVSAQFLRPLLQHYEHGAPAWALRALPYLSLFPPALAGHAVAAAAQDRWAGVLSGADDSESRLIEQPHSAMAAASGAAARQKRKNPQTGRQARSAIDEPLTGLTPHC